MTLHAFFDESYNNRTFCVAGYLYRKSRMQNLDVAWHKMLSRFGVRYFRMSECAHGNGEFGRLAERQRIAIAKEAIGLIKSKASIGIVVTVAQNDFASCMQKNPIVKSPYELCAWACIAEAAIWSNAHVKNAGIAYAIEAGDSSEANALTLLNRVMATPQLKDIYKVSRVISVPKTDSLPCQSADILAWQWLKDRGRRLEKLPVRADLKSLLELEHHALHLDAAMITKVSARIAEGVVSGAFD